MAYIGKVVISNEWQKLDSLIKAQIDGQSSFSFDSDSTYQLQQEGSNGARFCESASVPAAEKEGFIIEETQIANYKKGTNDLYVRKYHETNDEALIKISTVGE